MKFRKKPVVVEAVQFDESKPVDEWPIGVIETISPITSPFRYIDTLEGRMQVRDGDWVITGVKGEKYPCKPDIFEATYEAVS